mgnify:CR=1 FL=1
MNAKKKAKLSTFWFMVKSNFQASPILFPILIILYMMVIVIGAFLLFIVKDATNSMIDVIEGTGTVDRVFRLVGIYLVSQLVIILVINWFQDTTAEKTFVQFDAYYKKLCMYKFGKLPQENMYDNEVYEKYQFTYWNIYMFEMMPWQLIQFFVNFGFSKLLYLGIIFAFNIYLGLYCLLLLIINFSSNTYKSDFQLQKDIVCNLIYLWPMFYLTIEQKTCIHFLHSNCKDLLFYA